MIRQANKNDLAKISAWTLAQHQHEDNGMLKTLPEFPERLSQWIKLELDNP